MTVSNFSRSAIANLAVITAESIPVVATPASFTGIARVARKVRSVTTSVGFIESKPNSSRVVFICKSLTGITASPTALLRTRLRRSSNVGALAPPLIKSVETTLMVFIVDSGAL
ncbi:hypothetical protein D3C80_1952910 [compost metagenome]